MAVVHLSARTAWWSPSASVAAEGVGLGAGRARSTLEAVARLNGAAATYGKAAGAYSRLSSDSTRYEKRRGTDSGTYVVGIMKTFSAGPVVPVVASRPKFFEKPSFDPRPLLTERSGVLYEDPAIFVLPLPATFSLPVF